jgi:hypothetical protein
MKKLKYPKDARAMTHGIGIAHASSIEQVLMPTLQSAATKKLVYKCLEQMIPTIERVCPAGLAFTKQGRPFTAYGPIESVAHDKLVFCLTTPKLGAILVSDPAKVNWEKVSQEEKSRGPRAAMWSVYGDAMRKSDFPYAVSLATMLSGRDLHTDQQYIALRNEGFIPMVTVLGGNAGRNTAFGAVLLLALPASIWDQLAAAEATLQ